MILGAMIMTIQTEILLDKNDLFLVCILHNVTSDMLCAMDFGQGEKILTPSMF